MKKMIITLFLIVLGASIFGCANEVNEVNEVKEEDEQSVTNLVEDFGRSLQSVSLLALEDEVNSSMDEQYATLLSFELLESWKSNPEKAIGRTVSSPWPDRIEISKIDQIAEDTFQVQGEIIEITSVEEADGGIAARRTIDLIINKIEGQWRINEVAVGDYLESNALVYENIQFGFEFSLPDSWENYTILDQQWEGYPMGEGQEDGDNITGPMRLIRHPLWTEESQRQDIPLMIFTLDQWTSLEQDQFHIGAAPVGPKELGRNKNYVFALPARYNFQFLTGFEEVEALVDNGSFLPIQ